MPSSRSSDAERDPALDALAPELRRTAGEIWRARATSELGAGSGFAQAIVGLYAIGARTEVLELATQAAHEEVAHALACHRLAELYLGEPVARPVAKKVGMPAHAGATDPIRATLHVIGLSCLNETIAVELVSMCLDASEARAVRESASQHLRDEIGHARVGWAHLASDVIDARDRGVIAKWLPRLVTANGRMWLERVRALPRDGIPGHGYPPVADLERGLHRALETVIVPGFAEVGLDATGAARALAAL